MIASPDELQPQDSIKAERILAFNWRQLTALGLSWEDARVMAKTLVAKRLMCLYWRRLRRVGVSADDARRIARAVAKFDAMDLPPTLQQQQLIHRYCPAVCRCGLWRADLLLASRS